MVRSQPSGQQQHAQRIALLQRYLALFGPGSIALLLADREFIGTDWMRFQIESWVFCAIRVRQDLVMARADGCAWSIATLP